MPSRLYIATRDPREGGGVAAKARFLYDTAEAADYDPCLVFNNLLDRETQIRLSNPLELVGFDQPTAIKSTRIDGREAKKIPLIFPEIEFTQSIANSAAWREAVRDGDVFFAVCGTNLCSVPFVKLGVPFGSWTGTLLWEDRTDRLTSAPLIERVRDRLSRPILEYLERTGYRSADPAMVVSNYTAERIASKHGLPRDSIEVVPFPIDTTRFHPLRSEAGERDGPVVLFAGRFNDPRKNVSLLIDSFATVLEAHPNSELWLMGDDPSERVRTLVADAGVSHVTTFCGKVPADELSERYRNADVFAIPSNQEGLAIVGLEAMASGLPVVTTQCGGPTQYVEDGVNGYVVPRDDKEAFSEAIAALCDEERRKKMGDAARDLVEREYAERTVRDRFIDALERLETKRSVQ